jgi:hypothetical protein
MKMFCSPSKSPRALRFFAVILAITAMLCVSAASVSAAHTHLKEPVDRCGVCQTAHLTTQKVATVQVLHAPELQSLLATPITVQRPESGETLVLLTRGPPSSPSVA